MNDWVAKRFWTDVNIAPEADGFAIQLDGRAVKTPAKVALVVPTVEMANAIAAEWRAVEEKIDPEVMPFTRSANAAIDKVSTQFSEVADLLAAYGGSDLLCYRAATPTALLQRQTDAWDPLLDWAFTTFGARLHTTTGVMPVEQNKADLLALSQPLYDASAFQLAGLHDLISLSGSLVLALGVTQGHVNPETAWNFSRIDEIWQAEQWGVDEEAEQLAQTKRLAFDHAADFFLMA